MNKKLDTRERIIEVANIMFAERGYDGTSIREIAKKADVNLAAINYHFINKQNLYFEVVRKNKQRMDHKIKQLFEQKNFSTAQVACEVHRLLYEAGPALINAFKVMLSKTIPIEKFMDQDNPKDYGIVGSEYFDMAIQQELGTDCSIKARVWCLKGIITYIMHLAIMRNTLSYELKLGNVALLVSDNIDHDISMHTQALLQFAKLNPEQFV